MKTSHVILIYDSEGQNAENIAETIRSSSAIQKNVEQIIILTAHSLDEASEHLNSRVDIDLIIFELTNEEDENDELCTLQTAKETQQSHLRIIIHTKYRSIVQKTTGDIARMIAPKDRYLNGYGRGQFPGDNQSKELMLRNWILGEAF